MKFFEEWADSLAKTTLDSGSRSGCRNFNGIFTTVAQVNIVSNSVNSDYSA